MKAWLVLYNLASAVGWAYVLSITVQSFLDGKSPEELWNEVGTALTVVQSAAILEVVHCLLRWVRSPLMTTVMQVSSRLLLVWGYSVRVPACQAHWSLYLMAASWAMVEVPRYLFYAANLLMEKVPYPLFFLRYNLFMVLYPSGISGECFQMYTALPTLYATNPVFHAVTVAILVLYMPGGPFMISSMFGQRARANKKRNPRPPPKSGLMWPITNAEKGERSTTVTGREIWAASLDGTFPKRAAAVRATRNWRFGYSKHVIANVQACASSTANCVAIAKAGLAAAHDKFQMVFEDGRTMSMAEHMRTDTTSNFHTAVIKGKLPRPSSRRLVVPYKGKRLSGTALADQVRKWVAYGTIEPSAGQAIIDVAEQPGKFLDLSNKYFVLLGATSAMGPLHVLMQLGANVIAVDLDRSFIWDKLLRVTEQSCGTLYVPLKIPAEDVPQGKLSSVAGCNLFTDAARIRNWLVDVVPDKQLTIGGYAYLDGALHVQLAVAMDAIMAGVSARRPDTKLCFLCSPTDVFVSTDEGAAAAQDNLRNATLWQRAFHAMGVLKSNVSKPVPSDGGSSVSIVNGLVVAQGPNYALAKRIQHWRAMLSHHAGQLVSTNIAPSTATASVVHNSSFAAAYGGMHKFRPMEVFMQETSNAVMGALMLHDVSSPSPKLANPALLFRTKAFHGGIWRMGFRVGSIGVLSASYFYLKKYGLVLLGAIGGLDYFGYWLYTSTAAAATATASSSAN